MQTDPSVPSDYCAAEASDVRKRSGSASWPAWYALLTAWTLPATTTRRMAHVPLKEAFAVHVVSGLLTFLVILMFAAWVELSAGGGQVHVVDVMSRTVDWCGDFAAEWRRRPGTWTLRIASVVLAIELIVACVAAAALPFGARDERLGDSIRHALRRTWLHSPHALAATIIVGLIVAQAGRAHERWYQEAHAQFERLHPHPRARNH